MADEIRVVSEETGQRHEFPWGTIAWLANRELTGGSAGLTFGVVTIRPGERNMAHLHSNCDELVYVERGRIEHTLEEASATLGPGDLIHVPQGRRHSAWNLGTTDARLIVVYNTADRRIEPAKDPGARRAPEDR